MIDGFGILIREGKDRTGRKKQFYDIFDSWLWKEIRMASLQ